MTDTSDKLGNSIGVAETIETKYEALKQYFRDLGSVAVAYSSGVDSTLVLWVAHEVLGDKTVAYTATSPIYPPYETSDAIEFCKEHGIPHVTVPVYPLEIEGLRDNPADRCYHCKKLIFSGLMEAAAQSGLAAVADGTNADDTGMYRPGMRALAELDVVSPLKEVGMTKAEIRELSQELGLPTWNKATFACLMTRFEYDTHITDGMLDMVGKGELFLIDLGFRQLRVRYMDGDVARIELGPDEMERMLEPGMAARIDEELRSYGFKYVTLDLGGYATGKGTGGADEKLLQNTEA